MTDDELKRNYENAVMACNRLVDELKRRYGNKSVNVNYTQSYCNYFRLSDLTQPWIKCNGKDITLCEMLCDSNYKWMLHVYEKKGKDVTFPIYDLENIKAIADKIGYEKYYEQLSLF